MPKDKEQKSSGLIAVIGDEVLYFIYMLLAAFLCGLFVCHLSYGELLCLELSVIQESHSIRLEPQPLFWVAKWKNQVDSMHAAITGVYNASCTDKVCAYLIMLHVSPARGEANVLCQAPFAYHQVRQKSEARSSQVHR